jgi:tetratricopeptide (TPR) repeat protein
LKTYFINESEGAVEMQNAYLNIYGLRCLEYIKSAQYEKALGEVVAAQSYPVGLNLRPRYAQFDYLAGIIYKEMGEKAKAAEQFGKAIAVKMEGRGVNREDLYYQGLALQELGNSSEARSLFLKMLSEVSNGGEGELSGRQPNDLNVARVHYLTGLAYKGLGEREKARAEFGEALQVNPSDIWSEVHLSSL